jgi:hypothetical protein
MSQHTYTVELRIFGLEPELVTRDLALGPCQTWHKGIERIRGKTDPDMWAYNGTIEKERAWESLDEGLSFVLDKVWDHREAVAKYMQAGARVLWWCGHFYSSFDGGPSLSPGLLGKLGGFGVELFIDNYYHPEE